MRKERIASVLEEILDKDESIFLIDLSVTPDNTIKVVVDGDNGVVLGDCVAISRSLEQALDREEEDFSLEVTSAGATAPILLPRQFKKNVGRKLKVATTEESYEGNLVAVADTGIVLEWKSREPKPVGKGKHTVQKRQEIGFEEIKEAKVILKF